MKLLRYPKKLFIGVKGELERYCDIVSVFCFNSLRYDLNLIEEYLLEVFLRDFHCSPSVIKSCNKYIAMIFMGLQVLDLLSFSSGATSLDKFLKAYATSEEKRNTLNFRLLKRFAVNSKTATCWKKTSICTIVYSKRRYLSVLL